MNATAHVHLLEVVAGDLEVRPSRSTSSLTREWISVEVGRGEDVHVLLSFVGAEQARAFFNAGLAQLDALAGPGEGPAT